MINQWKSVLYTGLKPEICNNKMKRLKYTTFTALVICFLTMVLSSSAFAHKVNIYAYVEGDTVFTESYFPDGKKVQNGKIKVYDEAGQLLLEGLTDTNGQFTFRRPLKNKLNIALDASMGHRDEFVLRLNVSDNGLKKKELKKTGIPFKKAIYGVSVIFVIAFFIHYFLKKNKRINT